MEKKKGRYSSFFMGGFECADHINRSGQRVNLLEENEHDTRVEEDYNLLLSLGISTVREGVCWSKVETSPNVFEFSGVKNRMAVAEKLGIQIIWDLCHFGYPDDIYPTHPFFTGRFRSLCRAFALFYREHSNERLCVVPINEISFLSWHSGEVRGTVPFAVNSGFDIKYHLCKAAIEGMKVLRETLQDCEIFVVEPLIKIHRGDSEVTEAELTELNSHQFQAMDIIAGNMCPELGGSPNLFDTVGLNYYHCNQWDHLGQTLNWPQEERELTPVSTLLSEAYMRYSKPVILAETGHFGVGRAKWLQEITAQCIEAMDAGVDLHGICLYPIIDRPDWDNLLHYHNSGIYDLDEMKNRIPNQEYVEMIINCVQKIKNYENISLKKGLSDTPDFLLQVSRFNHIEGTLWEQENERRGHSNHSLPARRLKN